jgi:hypothetical protein
MARRFNHVFLANELLSDSLAARQVAERAEEIMAVLKRRPRKVWPTAQIARLFGVSTGLLRQWMARKLLAKAQPPRKWLEAAKGRPLRGLKPGIDPASVKRLVKALAEGHQYRQYHHRTKRARPAADRYRAILAGLGPREKLTAAELSRLAKISVSTVYRLSGNENHPGRVLKLRRSRRKKKRRVLLFS